jgi:hypothetical protein
LSPSARKSLDSFALRVKNFPLAAFTIAGNTDNSGNGHKLLSKMRVQNSIKYLEQRHNIKSFRFLELYLGDSNPTASNDSENGRKINRRVDIRQTSSEFSDILYRNLLLAVFNRDFNKSYDLLNIWLHTCKEQKKLYVLFDPRLDPLKSDPKWKNLVYKKIKETYSVYKKPVQSFLLDSLGKEDQKCRTLNRYIENLNSYYEPVDSFEKRFDVSFSSDTITDQCEAQDEARYRSLKKLIGEKEWPRSSDIGERAAKCAFLILTHSTDSSAIAQYLPFIEKRCVEGEAEWIHYAMLYDRLQVMRNLPQRFGTQYKPPPALNGDLELFPLENRDKVNQWRKEIGIEPLKIDK